jgi:hypothetical protein
MFGKWPIDTFNELSAEQQVAVWQSGNSKQALQAALVEEVSKQKVDEEIRRTAGSFLPLSVYVATGYTADMVAQIELGCEKRFDNELQVWTYKKTIHTDVKDVVTRKVREELLNLRNQGLRSKLSRDARPTKKSRKRQDRPSSSSDSSKSSKKSKTRKKSASSKSSQKSKSSSSSSDSPNTIRLKATAARKERLKAAAFAKARAAELAKQEKAAAATALKEQAKDPMRLSCTCICTSIILNTR